MPNNSSPTALYATSEGATRRRVTVPSIREAKGQEPLVMVTAYDAPTARIVDDAGVDMILVGDSVAMVVLGYDDTLQVSLDDMCHHTAAVARAKPSALIVGDLPWMSYHLSAKQAVKSASELIRAGAGAVKLEGGKSRVKAIKAMLNAEIPVMGHLGLTPQSIHTLGGFKVQGKVPEAIETLRQDAAALQDAGCFAIVLECVPSEVASLITAEIDVPTIGIGAGPNCDGQVLVFHDLVEYQSRLSPKFVRKYAHIQQIATEATAQWVQDVKERTFPTIEESYSLPAATSAALRNDLAG